MKRATDEFHWFTSVSCALVFVLFNGSGLFVFLIESYRHVTCIIRQIG